MTPGLGIEPGTHWWETSALTAAPSLIPSLGEWGSMLVQLSRGEELLIGGGGVQTVLSMLKL